MSRVRRPRMMRGGPRLIEFLVVAAIICTHLGCSGGTAGDEGTVDLVKAQEAASSNPDLAKKSGNPGAWASPRHGRAVASKHWYRFSSSSSEEVASG